MKYDVKVIDKGDSIATFSAAVRVAKAIDADFLNVEFPDKGFSIGVSKESRVTDLHEIYRLKCENLELKQSDQPSVALR